MAFFDWGNPPINSTDVIATNPSSGAILAFTSTVHTQSRGGNFFFWITVGASTRMTFGLERMQDDSTTLSTVTQRVDLFGAISGQTASYPVFIPLERGEWIRVKAGDAITGTAQAFITGQQQT